MYLDRLNALIAGGFYHAEGDGGDAGAGGGADTGAADTGGAADAGASGDAGADGAAAAGSGRQRDASGKFAGAGAAAAAQAEADWRAAIAGEDKDTRALLERLTTPADLGKKLLNQEKLIRTGQYRQQELPADATPEQVAEYRKALGIPDKPDGYEIAYPKEMQPTEGDSAVLNEYREFAHNENVPPAYAKKMFDFYLQRTVANQQAKAEQAREAFEQNNEALRQTFSPAELKRNQAILKDFFETEEFFDQEGLESFETILGLQLPNGLPVREWAPFAKTLFRLARINADPGTLVAGDTGGGGGKSLADEKAELLNIEGRRKYTPQEEARLTEIFEAELARESRRGRQRVA